jgi:hypothetical protein
MRLASVGGAENGDEARGGRADRRVGHAGKVGEDAALGKRRNLCGAGTENPSPVRERGGGEGPAARRGAAEGGAGRQNRLVRGRFQRVRRQSARGGRRGGRRARARRHFPARLFVFNGLREISPPRGRGAEAAPNRAFAFGLRGYGFGLLEWTPKVRHG